MRRHAKAATAGSTKRQATGLGRFFRGAFATRHASPGAKGSGAPSFRRLAMPIGVFAAIVALSVFAAAAIAAAAPQIVSTTVSAVSHDSAVLEAEIDPEGKATTYHFEYGTADCASNPCASVPVPDGNVGSKSSPVLVTDEAEGLSAATTYHFRVVAENELGTTEGEGHTFTTYSAFTPNSGCPNREVRVGPAARLPDCRGYELVSPVVKNGGSVAPPTYYRRVNQSALDGGKIAYTSLTPFAGAQSGTHINQYVATRGGDGWTTEAVSPPLSTGLLKGIAEPAIFPEFEAFSEDLSSAWVESFSRYPLTVDAIEGWSNFYQRDTATGGYAALTTTAPPESGQQLFVSSFVVHAAASADREGAGLIFGVVVARGACAQYSWRISSRRRAASMSL